MRLVAKSLEGDIEVGSYPLREFDNKTAKEFFESYRPPFAYKNSFVVNLTSDMESDFPNMKICYINPADTSHRDMTLIQDASCGVKLSFSAKKTIKKMGVASGMFLKHEGTLYHVGRSPFKVLRENKLYLVLEDNRRG